MHQTFFNICKKSTATPGNTVPAQPRDSDVDRVQCAIGIAFKKVAAMTKPPGAPKMAPPARPFHERHWFWDAWMILVLLQGLIARYQSHLWMLATIDFGTVFGSPLASGHYVTTSERDLHHIQSIFEHMSIQTDEIGSDITGQPRRSPKLYEFNELGELIIPHKPSSFFLSSSEATDSNYSSASGTPSPVTSPSSSIFFPSSPLGPDTPSASTAASPILPSPSRLSFKGSSASFLNVFDFSHDDASITPPTSPTPLCMDTDTPFYQRRFFAATSSCTLDSPGGFEESGGLEDSLILPVAEDCSMSLVAQPTPPRPPPTSSQTFGNPGHYYAGSSIDGGSAPSSIFVTGSVDGVKVGTCDSAVSVRRVEPSCLENSGRQAAFPDRSRAPLSPTSAGLLANTCESRSFISSYPPGSATPGRAVGLHDFRIQKMLGNGAFRDVYLAERRVGGTLHAMKVVSKKKAYDSQAKMAIMNEKDILRRLAEGDSPFAVNLHATFSDTKNFYFITNFFPGGDLEGLIGVRDEPFDAATLKSYSTDLIQGLTFLHKNRIIHRDIKSANIFIDANGHLVLGDHGLARIFDTGDEMFENPASATMNEDDWGALGYCELNDMTDNSCGTLGYAAPEIVLSNPYSALVDIWSLGVTFYEMTFGMMPFQGQDKREVMAATAFMQLEFPDSNDRWPIEEELKDLIREMLVKEQRDRIRLQAVTQHTYFEGVDWDTAARRDRQPDPVLDRSYEGDVKINVGQAYRDGQPNPGSSFNFVSPKWERNYPITASIPRVGSKKYSLDLHGETQRPLQESHDPNNVNLDSNVDGDFSADCNSISDVCRLGLPVAMLSTDSPTSSTAVKSGPVPNRVKDDLDSGSVTADIDEVADFTASCRASTASSGLQLVIAAPQQKILYKPRFVCKSGPVIGGVASRTSIGHRTFSVRDLPLKDPRFLVTTVCFHELGCHTLTNNGSTCEDVSGVVSPSPHPFKGSRFSVSPKGCSRSTGVELAALDRVNLFVTELRVDQLVNSFGDADPGEHDSAASLHGKGRDTGPISYPSNTTSAQYLERKEWTEPGTLVNAIVDWDVGSSITSGNCPRTEVTFGLSAANCPSSSFSHGKRRRRITNSVSPCT